MQTAALDVIRVRLPVASDAARRARAEIDQLPELVAFDDLRFTARLLTSELVTNVVQHAHLSPADSLSLSIECNQQTVRVQVADDGAGFDPRRARLAQQTEDGRLHGIGLINVLADRWDYHSSDDGSRLWFELDLIPARRPSARTQDHPPASPSTFNPSGLTNSPAAT